MDIKEIEKISKALADPYRLKIMDSIRKQQNWLQCSCVVDMFDLAQSTVSHHIKQLVDADLLIVEKEGRTTRYQVNKEVFGRYIDFLTPYQQNKNI